MTMRFAPLAHLRSTQPTSHLQAYSAADELDAAVARGEQVSYRMRTEMRAKPGYAAHQVLVAIQILANLHGAGGFAESSPLQQFWRDANTAARHGGLNAVIGYEIYGKALLAVEERIDRMV
jgi:3-hydroxy-9,10-secoandrosta-1,3,5(10)-triene-9,17-dione monooxygenase